MPDRGPAPLKFARPDAPCGEGRACPLCDSPRTAFFHAWSDFQVRRCADCGFAYIDPEAWTDPYTQADYYTPAAFDDIRPGQPHLRRRVADLRRYVPRGRTLDVGCGRGEVSLLLAEAGFAAEGIDESPCAIEHLQARFPHIQWHCGSVLERVDELGTFDAVTLYHVLEHLRRPREAVARLRRLLRPGGLLVVEVPNAGGLKARLKGPRWHYYRRHHLSYFRAEHLVRLAELAGLAVVEMKGFYHSSFPQQVWWKDWIKGALAGVGFQDVVTLFARNPGGHGPAPLV